MWNKKTSERVKQGYQDANDAWLLSVEAQERVEAMRSQVEAVVEAHRQLQRDNHFAQRIAAAYRGE